MKKSRIIALVAVLVGIVAVAVSVLLELDGSRFVLRFPWVCKFLQAFGIATAISGLFCLIFNKSVNESCTLGSSALALGLSACAGIGLGCLTLFIECMLNPSIPHPLRMSCSVVGVIACLEGFVYLNVKYIDTRVEKPSRKGVVLDELLAIIYMPAFYTFLVMVFCFLTKWIGEDAIHV